MITFMPGFRMETVDSVVIDLLKSEGILEKWDSIKLHNAARFMIYDPVDKKERWFVQECLLEGDEGLVLTIISFNVMKHPTVLMYLKSLEKLNGITADSKIWPLGMHTKETQN